MTKETTSIPINFLRASELLEVKGIKSSSPNNVQNVEIALPKTGRKYFEPNGSWLQEKQLESGIKIRKKLLEVERVGRLSQLGLAEWLPNIQKARVIKHLGKMWTHFGHHERGQYYLLPEEALILLEMNCLELTWNRFPLSIEQAYGLLIHGNDSKCSLDEYRVYSQLIRHGYNLKRYIEKSPPSATKRIIMKDDGFWTSDFLQQKSNNLSSSQESHAGSENRNSEKPSKLEIKSQKTIFGSIKIIRNTSDTAIASTSKWSGILVPNDITKQVSKKNNPSIEKESIQNTDENMIEKRLNLFCNENRQVKKFHPEVIELSDDEIEEIPQPMSRMDILNTLPNIATNKLISTKIDKAYIPNSIKPYKDSYQYKRSYLLSLPQNDTLSKSTCSTVNESLQVYNGTNHSNSHFYTQRNHETVNYGSNNGYTMRNLGWQQNFSHNTTHNSYTGTIVQSNMNYVIDVMSHMFPSFRYTQQYQTTLCQNFQIYQRFPYNNHQRYHPYSYSNNHREFSNKRTYNKNRYRSVNDESTKDDYCSSQPSFTVYPGNNSWVELKRKWAEESTITIDDEDTASDNVRDDNNEVQVIQESLTPLIHIEPRISNISEVYDRLRIIKSASEKSLRSRKVDYALSYEIYSSSDSFKRVNSGLPIGRIFVINTSKEPYLDFSKLQRLKQDSKDIPIILACVSQNSISYNQLGIVFLPNLQ